jgi:hypothetical protein
MREVVIIPQYKREELLFCCLKRIREFEPKIDIHVFPDRGTYHEPAVRAICEGFSAVPHLVPDNDWYGNTANVMEAYLWAYNAGYDRIYYIESDVMVHSDFFSWHRTQHEEFPFIFGSMAWIFNRHAPITNDVMFQPWFYSIGVCFSRDKLAKIVEHATPKYYADMPGYIAQNFTDSNLNNTSATMHFEQDGLIQKVLDVDLSQTVSPGIAKCSHMGFVRSYDAGDTIGDYISFLGRNLRFDERVERVESFIADEYWRAEIFGREIVEREVGHFLPKREFVYQVKLPNGWETTYRTELKQASLPKRIYSVDIPTEAEIVLIS